MSRLLTLFPPRTTTPRVYASNGNNLPAFIGASSNVAHNAMTTHTTGPEAVSEVELFFLNGLKITNGEQDAYYDFTLRCSVLYNGTFYPAYDAVTGDRDISLSKAWGLGRWKVPGLTIPARTRFQVINRRVANDSATAVATITAVTNANPAVVTATGHALLAGQQVVISGVVGMTQLNGNTYTVSNPTANTFELRNSANSATVNSTAYGTYTSGGAANRQYNVLAGTSGIRARQDGVLADATGTRDFTLGVGLGYGAKAGTPTVSGGAVTAVPVASGGFGYTSGVSSDAWYGPAGAGAAGALVPGSGYSAVGSRTGTAITSVGSIVGGSGHDPLNPPLVTLGGGSTNNSFGSGNQANYGPVLITGKTPSGRPGLIILSDSNEAGYGSADSTGDLNGSHGAVEQAIGSNRATWKLCKNGESASGWNANNARTLALLDAVKATGVALGDVLIGLAPNDFGAGSSYTAVEGHVSTTKATMLARGCKKVFLKTVPPNTTSTDAFVTTANQTALNANYGAGGDVLTYNTRLRGGLGVPCDGFLDPAIHVADATTNWKWRTAGTLPLGAVTGKAFTDDGPHYSKGVGIPYLVANLDTSAVL